MFKLSHEVFTNAGFMGALEIVCMANLPAKTAWNVARIYRQCKSVEKELKRKVQKIVKKHLKLDEFQNPIPIKVDDKVVPGEYEALQPGGMEEFNKEYNALFKEESEINSYKICPDELEGIRVAGKQLLELEPIFQSSENNC